MGSIQAAVMHFEQEVTFGAAVNLPNSTVTNASIIAGAGILSTKVQRRIQYIIAQGERNTEIVSCSYYIHIGHGATGLIRKLEIGVLTKAVGDSEVAIDLLKRSGDGLGTDATVLSAPITLDNTGDNDVKISAAIASAAYVADDILTLEITVTAGTGTIPKGMHGFLMLDEDPQ